MGFFVDYLLSLRPSRWVFWLVRQSGHTSWVRPLVL